MWKRLLVYELTYREREIVKRAIEIVKGGGVEDMSYEEKLSSNVINSGLKYETRSMRNERKKAWKTYMVVTERINLVAEESQLLISGIVALANRICNSMRSKNTKYEEILNRVVRAGFESSEDLDTLLDIIAYGNGGRTDMEYILNTIAEFVVDNMTEEEIPKFNEYIYVKSLKTLRIVKSIINNTKPYVAIFAANIEYRMSLNFRELYPYIEDRLNTGIGLDERDRLKIIDAAGAMINRGVSEGTDIIIDEALTKEYEEAYNMHKKYNFAYCKLQSQGMKAEQIEKTLAFIYVYKGTDKVRKLEKEYNHIAWALGYYNSIDKGEIGVTLGSSEVTGFKMIYWKEAYKITEQAVKKIRTMM